MFCDNRLDKSTLELLCYCLHAQEEKEKVTMGRLRNRFSGAMSLKKNMDKLLELGYAIRYTEKKLVPRSLIYEFFDTPLTLEEANSYEDCDDLAGAA